MEGLLAALLPGDHTGSVENGKTAAISINAARFNRNLPIFLIACEIFLIIIDATINYSRWIHIGTIRRLSNIAREDGMGTWFMSTQTLLAAFFIWMAADMTPPRYMKGWVPPSGPL